MRSNKDIITKTRNMEIQRKLELQEGTDDIKIIDVGSDNGDEIGAIFLTDDDEFDTNDRRPLAAEVVKRFNEYEKMRSALLSLMNTIDITGGVIIDEKGYAVPKIDPDWVDLGMVYEKAKAALGLD